MTSLQYILGIVAAVFTFSIVVEMLRRRRLRERHAMWWIAAGIFAMVISVFPQTLQWAATSLGFEVPVNLVFFVSLFILFLVALQHSSELTKLENNNRLLAEDHVLLKLRVEELSSPDTKKSSNPR